MMMTLRLYDTIGTAAGFLLFIARLFNTLYTLIWSCSFSPLLLLLLDTLAAAAVLVLVLALLALLLAIAFRSLLFFCLALYGYFYLLSFYNFYTGGLGTGMGAVLMRVTTKSVLLGRLG